MSTPENWHLMKHDDGTVFGPVTFEQIKEWAQAAQVSPLDKVSRDETTWIKAPMFAELEMDWLLQMSNDYYYGPTTLSSIQEFIKEGEINDDTIVINCKNGKQTKVADLPFRKKEPVVEEASVEETPAAAVMDDGTMSSRMERLEARIDALEATLNDLLMPR